MNYSKYIFTLILISFSFVLSGQVTVNEEPIVKDAMAKYKRVNASIDFVRAWRIQIITTDDRRSMEKAIRDFERLYPHINFDWEHNAPYYQVRVGAYEKREDLEAFLLEIKNEFPSAIPVQADIEKKELITGNG